MDLLRIYDEEDLRSLPSGVWGIKEPTFQYLDAPRMKGLYPPPTAHLPAHSLTGDDDGTWRGVAIATDGDSDPLDVILIPGKATFIHIRESHSLLLLDRALH
jgi:hypothetical protein